MIIVGDKVHCPFKKGSFGSVGCFLTGKLFGIEKAVVMLSNMHVLSGQGKPTPGDSWRNEGDLEERLRNEKGLAKTSEAIWLPEYTKILSVHCPKYQSNTVDEDFKILFKPVTCENKDTGFKVGWTVYQGARVQKEDKLDFAVAFVTFPTLVSNEVRVREGKGFSPKKVTGVRDPEVGETVYFAGHKTEYAEGTVRASPIKGVFNVKANPPYGQFTEHGDSGGGIYAKDGKDGEQYVLVGIQQFALLENSKCLKINAILEELQKRHSGGQITLYEG